MNYFKIMAQYFFKIINRERNHHGLQYTNGLIVDHQPFNNNPEASCVVGGIYFTTAKHLWKYPHYGCNLALVTIPDDAQIVMDKSGDKWRADRIYIEGIYPIQDLSENVRNIFFQELEHEEELPFECIEFTWQTFNARKNSMIKERVRPFLRKIKTIVPNKIEEIVDMFDKETAYPFLQNITQLDVHDLLRLGKIFDKETIMPFIKFVNHDNFLYRDIKLIEPFFGKETVQKFLDKWLSEALVGKDVKMIDIETAKNYFDKDTLFPCLKNCKIETSFAICTIIDVFGKETARPYIQNLKNIQTIDIYNIAKYFDKETARPLLDLWEMTNLKIYSNECNAWTIGNIAMNFDVKTAKKYLKYLTNLEKFDIRELERIFDHETLVLFFKENTNLIVDSETLKYIHSKYTNKTARM